MRTNRIHPISPAALIVVAVAISAGYAVDGSASTLVRVQAPTQSVRSEFDADAARQWLARLAEAARSLSGSVLTAAQTPCLTTWATPSDRMLQRPDRAPLSDGHHPAVNAFIQPHRLDLPPPAGDLA